MSAETIPDEFLKAADRAAASCFSGTSIRSRQGKIAIAKAIHDAVMAERAKHAWQPIETAPENRAILIHIPHLDYYGSNGVYAGILVNMGTGIRWMTFGHAIGRDLGRDDLPDAWCEFPAAPKAEG